MYPTPTRRPGNARLVYSLLVAVLVALTALPRVGAASGDDPIEEKVGAADGTTFDGFGNATAVWGPLLVVGASQDADNGTQSGSAYVFRRVGDGWAQEAKLLPSDGAAGDQFGFSVAIDEECIVVGAPFDDVTGAGVDAGSAYIFRRVDGEWIETAKLGAGDGAADDRFGYSVAIADSAGDIVAAGAYHADATGADSGAVYVIRDFGGDQWFEEARLTPAESIAGDNLGYSVSLSGDLLVASALFGNGGLGAVHPFRTIGDGVWIEEPPLVPGDISGFDGFGIDVAVSGSVAVVGCYLDDDHGNNAGAIYVFRRSAPGIWSQEQKLVASDAVASDFFGGAVAIDTTRGERVVARSNDDSTGAVYVFDNGPGGWFERNKLVSSDAAVFDFFGSDVAVWRDLIVCGAFGDDDLGESSGSTYVFDLLGDAPCPVKFLNIGYSLSIGDPVNSFTGAFLEQATDLSIDGLGIDFTWTRSYDSNVSHPAHAELGTAWTASYLQNLVPDGPGGLDILYAGGNGRVDLYAYVDGVSWESAPHYYHDLVRDAGAAEFVMTANAGRRTIFHDFTSTEPGRLKRIEDRFGNGLDFLYTAGLLTSVVDSYGRIIEVSHNADGTIHEIIDFSGRRVTYGYYQPGDVGGRPGQLRSVAQPEVSGTSTGNDFAGAGRKTTVYTYNTASSTDPVLMNQLLTVTDPRGNTYLVNEYSATDDPADFLYTRVVSQEFGGDAYQMHYQEIAEVFGTELATAVVIVNDRRGVVTETRLNERGNPVSQRIYTGFADPALPTTLTENRPTGPVRAGDPAFFETLMEYDSEGKPLRTVAPRGNFSESVFASGLPVRHAQDNPLTVTHNVGAVGGPVTELVTTRTYESLFGHLKTETDPKGNTTTYVYDYEEGLGSQGLLVRIEHPVVTLGLAASSGNQAIVETFAYNAFGQKIEHVDGEGNVTTWEYYPQNDPDGDGNDIVAGLDSTTGGYLKQVTIDPGGLDLTTVRAYDAVGNLVSETDPRGHTTSYEVNALDQVVREFSPALNLFAEDGGAVHEKAYIFDANDNLVEMWTELENGLNDGIADTPGFGQASFLETVFEYDVLDRVVARTVEVGSDPGFSASSLTTGYVYDASGNKILTIHPNGDQDAVEYDERDMVHRRIVAADGPAPSVTTFDYDPTGNVVTSTRPNPDNIVTHAYDGFDRLVARTVVGKSTTTTFVHDANSNVVDVQVVGPHDEGSALVTLSHVERLHDQLDRVYETVLHLFRLDDGSPLPGGLTTAISETGYDRNGLAVLEINPNGNFAGSIHDAARRLVAATDGAGNLVEFIYGDGLNVTQIRTTEVDPVDGPDVFTVTRSYDERNRRRSSVDDLAQLTRWELDSRGLPVTVVDGDGHERRFQYDGIARPVRRERQVAPASFITRITRWDGRSRVVESVDGEGRSTSLEYDRHNRPTLRLNADGTTRLYSWDVEDNLVELVRENQERMVYEHDAANRLQEVRYHAPFAADPTLVDRYDYNGLDDPTRIEQLGGPKIAYQRDSRSLIIESTQTVPGHAPRTFVAEHDALGNPTRLAYPGGRVVQYGPYSANDLLTGISSAGTEVDYSHAGWGRVRQRASSNGFLQTVEYDATRRVEVLEHSVGGTVRAGFTETYDATDMRRAELFEDAGAGIGQARVFDLDDADRVVGFIRHLDPTLLPAALADFSSITAADGDAHRVTIFDDANNMDSVVLEGTPIPISNNVMNEVESYGARTGIEHDEVGRMVSYQENGVTTTLTWNLRDQLVALSRDGVPVAHHEYYPTGMRARKWTFPQRPRQSVLARSGSAATREERFYGYGLSIHQIYGPDSSSGGIGAAPTHEFIVEGLDRPVVMFTNADRNDTTGVGGREAYFYHANPRGDVFALSNPSGDIVERYDYTLFGETDFMDGDHAVRSRSRYGNPFLFGGAYFDVETSLYSMRQRYYDPLLGAFLSRDPLEDDSLGNLYAGFENHPGSYTDPLGLWTVSRKGGDRAEAKPRHDKEPVAKLAVLIDLDVSEVKKWLREKLLVPGSPNQVTVGGGAGEDSGSGGETALGPYKGQKYVTAKKIYSVPNTAYVDAPTLGGGLLGFQLHARKGAVKKMWKKEGLKVVERTGSSASKDQILSDLGDVNIYKFAYFGHGTDGGSMGKLHDPYPDEAAEAVGMDGQIAPDPHPQYSPSSGLTAGQYTPFGIAEMWLIGCNFESRRSSWRKNVSSRGFLNLGVGLMHAFNIETKGGSGEPEPKKKP